MTAPQTCATLAAAFAFAFSACDKKVPDAQAGSTPPPAANDEKTAIANFKSEVESVGKWIDEKQKTPPTGPAEGMAMMRDIIARLKSIKTDGLPADLKSAWDEMSVILSDMGEVVKTMPSKPQDEAKAMSEMMPKMMAIQARIEPAAKKLKEAGGKYGIKMDNVVPQ